MNVSTAQRAAPVASEATPIVMDCKLDKIFYGNFMAVRDSHVPIRKNEITGFIGPSGCGKSTVLRSLNRMNDLVKGFRFEGHVHFLGQDVYGKGVDPVVVRRYIGMVFQQPVEELMVELKKDYTIALVTHNMQQAIRVADTTAFFSVDISQGTRTGYLVEMGPTAQIFQNPREQLTSDYISGKFS